MGRMTKYAHKPIVYDKLHGAKLDELIEYSNAMETRIVKNTNPKSDDNFDRNTRPSYTSHHTE